MRVTVNLVYDKEYKGYVADVPELPGCMSQRKTIEAALKNVREAIFLYLKTAPREVSLSSKPVLTTTLDL